jgi:hypothetical protein
MFSENTFHLTALTLRDASKDIMASTMLMPKAAKLNDHCMCLGEFWEIF